MGNQFSFDLFCSSRHALGETGWLGGLDGQNDKGIILAKLKGGKNNRKLALREWPS